MLDAAWSRRAYPGDQYGIPFGKGKLISSGDELTIVSWGAMVERCQYAAEQLEAKIELIDLRTITPWDQEMVLTSIHKTGKCLIVHEDIGLAGFGAEISATIAQDAFMDLDGPVERLAAPSIPVPFNLELMSAVVPTVDKIRQRMLALLAF